MSIFSCQCNRPLIRATTRLSRVWQGQTMTFAIHPLIITVTPVDSRVIVLTSNCRDHLTHVLELSKRYLTLTIPGNYSSAPIYIKY